MDRNSQQLLGDIKKLLVLGLVTQDVQGKDIADVLGVNKSTITRLVPSRKVRNSSKSTYLTQPNVFRPLIQIDRKPDHWSNIWWVQWLVAFFIVGILAGTIAGTISQVSGAYLIDYFKLANR